MRNFHARELDDCSSFSVCPSLLQHRIHHSYLLRISSLSSLLSLALSFFLVHVIVCDLFLSGYVDVVVTRRLGREYRGRIDQRGEGVAEKEVVSAKVRPREYGWLCCHPLFLSWQLVYRYGGPITIAILHAGCSVVTQALARLHTQAFYGLDLRSLTSDHHRRAAMVKPEAKQHTPSSSTASSARASVVH